MIIRRAMVVSTKNHNDDNLRYERNRFLIAALKTLFLRAPEFSERHEWIPIMGRFWEGAGKNWG